MRWWVVTWAVLMGLARGDSSPPCARECKPLLQERSTIALAVCLAILTFCGLVLAVVALCSRYRRLVGQKHAWVSLELRKALDNVTNLQFPFCLISVPDFLALGSLVSFEDIRARGQHTVLDDLASVQRFSESNKKIIFISHQWLSYTEPDPSNKQYVEMARALKHIIVRAGGCFRGWLVTSGAYRSRSVNASCIGRLELGPAQVLCPRGLLLLATEEPRTAAPSHPLPSAICVLG